MGAASSPLSVPVEKVNAGLTCAMLAGVMSSSALKRRFAASPAGVGHCKGASAASAANTMKTAIPAVAIPNERVVRLG